MDLLPAFTGAPQSDRVYHCDLLTLCAALPDASVDMILCDLPYGTTACAWDVRIPLEPMWAAFKRVIKPRGAIVLTGTEPFASLLRTSWLDGYKYDWVIDKKHGVNHFQVKHRPLTTHELACVFSVNSTHACAYYPQGVNAGQRTSTQKPFRVSATYAHRKSHAPVYIYQQSNYPKSIIEFSFSDHTNIVHPTQKPVALFEYLIRTYTQPGELVLDPCVGSGTTAIAARKTGRRFIVGDTSAEYVEIARHRLAGTLEVYKAVKEGQPYTVPMFAS